jgi:hypothetical protein
MGGSWMEEVLEGKDATYLLTDHHRLDKCIELLHLRFSQHAWEDILAIADHLHSLAEKMYNEAQEANLQKLPYLFKAERPLVFYYGFSYLAKGTALQKLGLYDQAREYILKYSELGWFSGLDKIGWEEVDRFKFFAKANLYTNDLLSGKLSVLPEYIQFLEDNPEELLPGLVTIMETASLHSVNIDDLLEKFSEKIEDFGNLEDATNRTHYFRFLYHRAIYYAKHQRYQDSVQLILLFLTSYNMINDADFKKFVVLFEVYRQYASNKQTEQYQNLCKELLKHEEGVSICDGDIRSR